MVYIFFSFLLIVFNIWNLYSVPPVLVGIRHFLRTHNKKSEIPPFDMRKMPVVSIIAPVKNESKVVGRLLEALLNLKYPSGKKEIIVVNDGSTDDTGRICAKYGSLHLEIRVFNRSGPSTKAAALNYGMQHAKGEIVATFDADSVPEPDSLLRVIEYFEDPEVAAVQGRICSINADENMLTKFVFYEEAVRYEAYTRGKDRLNLFVGLSGTCQFIRRNVLEEIGGWNSKSLSEDVELSLRLIEGNYVIRYASDVRTWEESPNSVQGLVRQRARWFRGNMEMGLRFGRLMRRPSLKRFDAEMTLLGTYLIVLCILSYFIAVWTFFLPPDFIFVAIMRFTSLLTLAIIAFAGAALVCVTKPFRLSNLSWLPFIYAYWGFQSFIAMYALLQIVFRRQPRWSKTKRSGIVTAQHAKDILATH